MSFFMGDFYSRKKAALGGTCFSLSPGGSPAFAGQGRNHAELVAVSAEPLPLVTARCRHVVFLSQEHNELSPPQTKSRSRKRIVGPHHLAEPGLVRTPVDLAMGGMGGGSTNFDQRRHSRPRRSRQRRGCRHKRPDNWRGELCVGSS